MSSKFQMDDSYNDVAARIIEFRAKHPEGSLQPASLEKPYEVREIGGQVFIVYTAAAYRTPDDLRPGIGVAQEQFPGRTPYTKGSELQNAETSAWGRAIVAALAADTRKGIASAEEVRNRQAERELPAQSPADKARAELAEYCKTNGIDPHKVAADFVQRIGKDIRQADDGEVGDYLALLKADVLTEDGAA